jgi:hypothetical protein
MVQVGDHVALLRVAWGSPQNDEILNGISGIRLHSNKMMLSLKNILARYRVKMIEAQRAVPE